MRLTRVALSGALKMVWLTRSSLPASIGTRKTTARSRKTTDYYGASAKTVSSQVAGPNETVAST